MTVDGASATAIPWTGRLPSTATRAARSRHKLFWFVMVSDPWLDDAGTLRSVGLPEVDAQAAGGDRGRDPGLAQRPRRAGPGTVPAIAGADTGLGDIAIPEIRRDKPRVAGRQGGGLVAHAARIRHRRGGRDFRR